VRERKMIVQDECGLGKSRSRVSAGVANFFTVEWWVREHIRLPAQSGLPKPG